MTNIRNQRSGGIHALLLSLLLLAGSLSTANAQEFGLSSDSRLWIDGTSNRDDWTVHAQEISARAEGLEEALAPSELELTAPAASIEGDRSTIMDRLMHDALKAVEHPTITYVLASAVAEEGGAALTTQGRLTIAGVTKEVEMRVEGERRDDDSIRFTGSMPLKMTDFGMQPPTAMFGALRTADDVTVHFDVIFVPAG